MSKVTIIGKGEGWEDAPRDELSWGITQLICRRPVDRVIDMNDYSLWGKLEADEAEKARVIAVSTGVEYIDMSNYPLARIVERFRTDYFTNTVDYAIALALFEGFTEIDFYGVNMKNPGEYAYQKPGVEFWAGYAMGMGVKVKAYGKETTILKTRNGMLYGYGVKQGLWNDN